MPSLTPAESLETTRIYSAMGLLKAGQPLMVPGRSAHPPPLGQATPGSSAVAATPQPGESASLADKGINRRSNPVVELRCH